MLCGKIKHYNTERGFGFIARDDRQPDLFFHINDVAMGCYPEMGAAVMFDVRPGRRSLEAFDVKIRTGT